MNLENSKSCILVEKNNFNFCAFIETKQVRKKNKIKLKQKEEQKVKKNWLPE